MSRPVLALLLVALLSLAGMGLVCPGRPGRASRPGHTGCRVRDRADRRNRAPTTLTSTTFSTAARQGRPRAAPRARRASPRCAPMTSFGTTSSISSGPSTSWGTSEQAGPSISPLQTPWSGLGEEVGGSLQANLGFEVRPATELRVRGTMSFYFPGPGPLFSEMIVDYSILNSVFFRAGIFPYTWGNSQFFLYGNLPGRGLSTWANSNLPLWERNNIITNVVTPTVPVSLKMNIPFGLNGLTLLARFDMTNYGFPDQFTPNPKYAGYGLQWDMVTGPIEWSLAGFYQNLLTPRSLLAMKTSLLGFDLSGEMTLASPISGGQFQGVYPTITAGISREWSDAHIKFTAEYGYNGERNPGLSLLPDNSGPGGHNSAMALRFTNLGDMGLAFTFLWQHNWSDGSGTVRPVHRDFPRCPHDAADRAAPGLWPRQQRGAEQPPGAGGQEVRAPGPHQDRGQLPGMKMKAASA